MSSTSKLTLHKSSILLYFLQCIGSSTQKDCNNMNRLNLHRLKPRCESDTPTDHRLTCINVLDLDPSTMWTPRYPLTRRHFIIISFNEAVKLTRIELLQYSWKLGYAKEAEINLNENAAKYRVRLGPPDKWSRIILPGVVEASSVKFRFRIDLNSTFGGIREISFFGCMVERNFHLERGMASINIGAWCHKLLID
ncbi:uncharacterized protein [Lepeophtheirus salmonis]|uniref:uncharacterized protein n=1 Tax=Lepeophtheirus salmonis TaxID=72036 RepID=UPI001AEAEA37|nr:uncharacterized protein LOC121122755 isoform X2 [Lepeophtheirus salmonis]